MIRSVLPLSLAVAVALASAASAVALWPTGTAAKPTQGRENIDPTWSPDGTRIAFVSTGSGRSDLDIWIMRADGAGAVNLTPDAVSEGSPAWSADGKRLAITSVALSGSASPSVEVIDADGGGRRVLAAGRFPAWSPDGGQIAYDGEGGVHVLDVVGGGDRLVAPVASTDAHRPSWSPDGRRITYIQESDVWVVDADGSDPTRLTSFPAPRLVLAPEWSPDGSRIAFLVVGPATAPEPNEVWTVSGDGGDLSRVMSAPFIDGAPDWSPDGRSLVFAASKRRDNDVELYRAAVPRGLVREVSSGHAWNETPGFAPDGGRLTFVVRYGGGYLLSDVWTLDLRTRRRRNLTGTASGQTIDARAVRPPNKLTLTRVSAWLDCSFPRPILRVEVRVSDKTRDEVRGALVTVVPRLRNLTPITRRVPVTDVHGDTQWAFRVRQSGAVRVGSRVRVIVSARPRKPYAQRVAVSRELQLLVAARPPLG